MTEPEAYRDTYSSPNTMTSRNCTSLRPPSPFHPPPTSLYKPNPPIHLLTPRHSYQTNINIPTSPTSSYPLPDAGGKDERPYRQFGHIDDHHLLLGLYRLSGQKGFGRLCSVMTLLELVRLGLGVVGGDRILCEGG
jgi:hypothetical protein